MVQDFLLAVLTKQPLSEKQLARQQFSKGSSKAPEAKVCSRGVEGVPSLPIISNTTGYTNIYIFCNITNRKKCSVNFLFSIIKLFILKLFSVTAV